MWQESRWFTAGDEKWVVEIFPNGYVTHGAAFCHMLEHSHVQEHALRESTFRVREQCYH